MTGLAVSPRRPMVAMVLQGGQPGPLLQALDGIKQVLVLVVARTTDRPHQLRLRTGLQ